MSEHPWETEGDEWQDDAESEWERLRRTTYPKWVSSTEMKPFTERDILKVIRQIKQHYAVIAAAWRNRRGD